MTETARVTGAVGVARASDHRVRGAVIGYRLFDVGYEIDLDRVFTLLAPGGPERPRPIRGEAQAIQIARPPVSIKLGVETITLGSRHDVEVYARVYDFGVLSLGAMIRVPRPMPWREYAALGATMSAAPECGDLFARARTEVVDRIRPAIQRPHSAPVTEDYLIYRLERLEDANGAALPPEALGDDEIARLLIGEARPLSAWARREMLSPRYAYFEDDLVVMTWGAALVHEPVPEDTDVQYVIEFANAQLLELRLYDAILDEEIPKIYDAIAEARRGFHLLGRRYSRLLASLQSSVADTTELVERAENALKVTDDVFLARVYAAALELFRVRVWRSGIDRKVAILRDTYAMLNGESQARRAEVLEVTIVLLIVIELILALLRP